mmetsp:Transcript_17557/g.41365  ORF Transcript_17557/g.41365 Transcript_17557/m.41365 type:complete len:81 (+) Transcript_17557:545-787(+)
MRTNEEARPCPVCPPRPPRPQRLVNQRGSVTVSRHDGSEDWHPLQAAEMCVNGNACLDSSKAVGDTNAVGAWRHAVMTQQ